MNSGSKKTAVAGFPVTARHSIQKPEIYLEQNVLGAGLEIRSLVNSFPILLAERTAWSPAVVTAVTPAVVTWCPAVIARGSAVISAAVALPVVTRTSRTAIRLYISLRLLLKSPHGESHLAALLIDFEQLDIHLVADLEHVSHVLRLLPGYLGHVKKAFLARKYLDECAEVKD